MMEKKPSAEITRLPALIWDRASATPELASALTLLGKRWPIRVSADDNSGTVIRFKLNLQAAGYTLTKNGESYDIEYAKPHLALRAVGSLWSGLSNGPSPFSEQTSFTTIGIMLDCSRNAVMKAGQIKQWLEKLALLGYNMAMLYTEDTFALPDEPYFGYLRGPYSAEEIRDIDRHALALGMELIPCIQTLGHLEQILKWPAYQASIMDTAGVMLVDEPATYKLIDKMLDFWSENCSTRRIHIGMDEAHDLGRGKFLDRHGYERGFEIFNRHLKRVVEAAAKRGLSPMIWSDMYFSMGSVRGDYYDKDCNIPPEVIREIPRQAQLVYWDYYHKDEAFYLDWIARHRALGSEPIMASGVWTWSKLWYDRNITEKNAGPCVRACRSAGLKEILFTLWGDDGATCDFESAWHGLVYAAELVYGGDGGRDRTDRRFSALCGGNLQEIEVADRLYRANGLNPSLLLWDDPLMNIYLFHQKTRNPERLPETLMQMNELASGLQVEEAHSSCGNLRHALTLARLLSSKIALFDRFVAAYSKRNVDELRQVHDSIANILEQLSDLQQSFRHIWHERNKPFGFEVIQGRLGWQKSRYEELRCRIEEYSSGKIAAIEELDVQLGHPHSTAIEPVFWRKIATSSSVF